MTCSNPFFLGFVDGGVKDERFERGWHKCEQNAGADIIPQALPLYDFDYIVFRI